MGVAALVNDVAEASKGQSISIDQINEAIAGIECTTNINTAVAEQSAKEVGLLSNQVNVLSGLVDDLDHLINGKHQPQVQPMGI